MVTRRNFLESAAVISGVALSGAAMSGTALTINASAAAPAQLNHLIYNLGFSHTQRFAQRLMGYGIRGVGISNDVTDYENDLGALWFSQLRSNCVAQCSSSTKPSIVGMGTHTDFFVLQSLARDIGLSTRFHAEHRRVQGAWLHQIKQNDWVKNEYNLAASDDWVHALANALSQRREAGQLQSMNERTQLMNSHEPRLLVSWVLG